MAGTLVIDTLKDGAGNSTSATNAIQGSAKAWVNFNGTITSGENRRASFNVSSVTYNGTGNYTINFSTAFADTNYAFCSGTRSDTDGAGYVLLPSQKLSDAKTISAFTFKVMDSSMRLYNAPDIHVMFFR